MTAAVVVLAVTVVVLGLLLARASRRSAAAHYRALRAELAASEEYRSRLLPETPSRTPIHDAVSRRLRAAKAADVLYAGPVAGGEGRG